MKAKDIMSADVFTVKKDTSVGEIAHLLTEKNISGVPVVDDRGAVVGMVTQRDLLYKDVEPRFPAVAQILGGTLFLQGAAHYNEELRKLAAVKAEDLMTKRVFTVEEDTEVKRVAELMVEREINRVPVTRNGKLTGIISRADIVRNIAKMME
ncbi:MAG: CBS domain-containing protein [Clostridiales bacterium]|jgi:CBS domain-containing protein|nr:CBS domain-containing protein [Eubacteriales bacterium]MDH7567816.1 CBS domain-containing protein [Clostridiales bacterium]